MMTPSLRMPGRLGQRNLNLYVYPDQYFSMPRPD